MRYLLDTHVVLWMFEDDPRLTSKSKQVLDAHESILYVSSICFWEITIKSALGKLQTSQPAAILMRSLEQIKVQILNILPQHLETLEKLPLHHKDPFDRLFIATALTESLVLISADKHFSAYESLEVMWQ